MKSSNIIKPYLLLIIPLLFISFIIGDSKSEYTLPRAAYSFTTGDLDLDGDMDIVVGHNYNSQTEWSGVSFLINNGSGTFFFNDSIFLYSWQTHIYAVNTNSDLFPEIIARHYENEMQYMAVLNFEQGNYVTYLYYMTYGISGNNIGDINGDNFTDIVIYSNDNQFWGVMYNDGSGNFSPPEYHNVSDYYPSDIACADLNDDGRDDIVVGGKTEIFFSYENGFQSLFFNTITGNIKTVDFDNDGDFDIIGAHQPMPTNYYLVTLIENLGEENFVIHPSYIFQPVCIGGFSVSDFNNDSLPELLFHTQDMQNLLIYYNKGNFEIGDSVFIPMADYGESTRRSACADFDGNGYNDIATIRYLHSPIINLNIMFNDGNGGFSENPITDIEIPTKKLQIPIRCYPNPVKNENVTFEFQNTSLYTEMELKCFDVFGREVYSERVYQNQGECKVNIQNWRVGIYVSLIFSNDKVVGKTKFIVE